MLSNFLSLLSHPVHGCDSNTAGSTRVASDASVCVSTEAKARCHMKVRVPQLRAELDDLQVVRFTLTRMQREHGSSKETTGRTPTMCVKNGEQYTVGGAFVDVENIVSVGAGAFDMASHSYFFSQIPSHHTAWTNSLTRGRETYRAVGERFQHSSFVRQSS